MAEKSVVFSLKVNTGNSVKDIENFDKAVENLNQDLKDTATTAENISNQGLSTFDAKLAELDQRLQEGGLGLRDMTKLMKEYQNLAAQAGLESPIGKQAITNAAGLKDNIGDVKAQTTALSSDFVKLDTSLKAVETGAAIFGGLQAGMALAGVENEDLQKTMVKLQAVQGVTNAISVVANNLNKEAVLGIQLRNGLEKASQFIKTGSIAPTLALAGAESTAATATGGATLALKALRVAMIATGIGALIVGIGMLIANFDIVKNAVMKAYDSFTKLGTNVKIVISIMFPLIGLIYGTIKALEKFGLIDDENERKRKANSEKNRERIRKEIAQNEDLAKQKKRDSDAENASMDNNIRLLEAQGKSTVALRIKQKERAIDEAKNLLAELELNLKILELLNSKTGMNPFGELINQTKDSISQQKIVIANGETDIQLIRIEAGKKAIEDKKNENKEKRKLATVDINQIIADEEALDEQLRLLTMTDDERALDAIQEKYFKLRTEAENAGKSIIDIDKAEAAEKKVITDKAAADRLASEKLLADERVRLLDSYTSIILTKEEEQIAEINSKDLKKRDDLKKSLDLKLISQAEYDAALIIQAKATADAIAEINKGLAEKTEKTELEKRKAIIDTFQSSLKLAQDVSSALGTMREISNKKELEGVEKGSQAEAVILKKQFEQGKKAQIATAIINGLQAQASILGQYPKFDGGFAMVAAMIGAAATSVATIAKIKATNFEGGGGAPPGPDPGLTSSTFSESNTNAQTTDVSAQNTTDTNQQGMVQVAVLEYDITNIQNKVSVQEVKSSF
jgi:hypothetical protein